MEGDGDLDICMGELTGQIFCFLNQGTPQMPAYTKNHIAADNPLTFTLGGMAHIAFYDIDGDGRIDALITARNAAHGHRTEIFFFRNSGSAAVPEFALDLNANPFVANQLSMGSPLIYIFNIPSAP